MWNAKGENIDAGETEINFQDRNRIDNEEEKEDEEEAPTGSPWMQHYAKKYKEAVCNRSFVRDIEKEVNPELSSCFSFNGMISVSTIVID